MHTAWCKLKNESRTVWEFFNITLPDLGTYKGLFLVKYMRKSTI